MTTLLYRSCHGPMRRMLAAGLLLVASDLALAETETPAWVVTDTGQDRCYDSRGRITSPKPGQPFFGQDAQYAGAAPAYRDNGDGTVTDLNTGLMWSQAVAPKKVTLAQAQAIAQKMDLGGHRDWRVPSIKELYTLIDFRGSTGMGAPSRGTAPRSAIPYINTDYFAFLYGGEGERYIDGQWLSSTRYVSTTMGGQPTLFGVNFADGRIKGYGLQSSRHLFKGEKTFYARYVRGVPYGENRFVDNGDGTVTDEAAGLMWAQADSGKGMDWEHALRYAENLELAGHDDWRLPNAKELQAIVDYTRSPDTTNSPALDPVFATTAITNEAGQKDWPFFWTSTTHLDGPDDSQAVYVAFGRAMGSMHGRVMDVHGAGAQRSDPKTGTARLGHGPQGDAQRVQNFVRCVRTVRPGAKPASTQAAAADDAYPNLVHVGGTSYRPQAGSGGSDLFIRRLDRDGDGKVSRQEFDGPPDRFSDFDRNGDGYVTTGEAPSQPPKGGSGPPR